MKTTVETFDEHVIDYRWVKIIEMEKQYFIIYWLGKLQQAVVQEISGDNTKSMIKSFTCKVRNLYSSYFINSIDDETAQLIWLHCSFLVEKKMTYTGYTI